METCKHNLHARVIWPKGSTPLTALALRKTLSMMWKDLSLWEVMSLGKGFYEFSFSFLKDVKRVISIASWNLNPGILKLFTWTRDFSPNVQSSSSAQVWLCIYGLSKEYWRPKILFAISSNLGTPICTDATTTKSMVWRWEKTQEGGVELCSQKLFFSFDQNCSQVQSLKKFRVWVSSESLCSG